MTRSPARLLLAWAAAYGLVHHLGVLPDGLGDAGGGTRWADWLELVGPWAVAGTALATLAAAGTDRRGWTCALVGAGLYLQGSGVHLAANSTSRARGDAAPVHLWDEVVGHAVAYAGVAVLVAVLARALAAPEGALRVTVGGLLVAALTGATWATNALGGDGLALPGALVAVAWGVQGWSLRRTAAGRLLLVTAGSGLLLLLLLALLGSG